MKNPSKLNKNQSKTNQHQSQNHRKSTANRSKINPKFDPSAKVDLDAKSGVKMDPKCRQWRQNGRNMDPIRLLNGCETVSKNNAKIDTEKASNNDAFTIVKRHFLSCRVFKFRLKIEATFMQNRYSKK